MSESQFTKDLQRIANIDKIRQAHRIVKARERQEILREHMEDAKELNFEDDM